MLFQPSDFSHDNELHIKDYFKSISHHPIKNAFHSLDFGSNIHNIHLAIPGECLHMHQLGIQKRQIEAFIYLIKGNVDDEHGPTSTKNDLNKLLMILVFFPKNTEVS